MKEHEDLARELALAKNFPKRVAYARQLEGYTQYELTRRITGKPSSMVCGWEKGTNKPRSKNVKMAAKVLGVRMEWLLSGEGDMRPVETFSTGKPDASLGTIAPQLADLKSNGHRPPPDDLDIQERLSWAMNNSGMSRTETAKAVGLSKATLGFWSASKGTQHRRAMKPEFIDPLAAILGVRPGWLRDGSLPVWSDTPAVQKQKLIAAVATESLPEQHDVPPRPYHAAKAEQFEYAPPRVGGFINVSLVESQLSDAIARRNEAAHEADQWQTILDTLRKRA